MEDTEATVETWTKVQVKNFSIRAFPVSYMEWLFRLPKNTWRYLGRLSTLDTGSDQVFAFKYERDAIEFALRFS